MGRTWFFCITLFLSAFLILALTDRAANTSIEQLAAGPCDPSISLCL
jgi:hypothetical protein